MSINKKNFSLKSLYMILYCITSEYLSFAILKYQYEKSLWISYSDVTINNFMTKLSMDMTYNICSFLIFIYIFNSDDLFEKIFGKISRENKYLIYILFLIWILGFILNKEYSFNAFFYYISMLISVAVPEEIIYRGILFNAIQRENRPLAMFMSCVLFGAVHGVFSYIKGDQILILAILFNLGQGYCSIIFIKLLDISESLIVLILVHAILDGGNGIALVLTIIVITIYIKLNYDNLSIRKDTFYEKSL